MSDLRFQLLLATPPPPRFQRDLDGSVVLCEPEAVSVTASQRFFQAQRHRFGTFAVIERRSCARHPLRLIDHAGAQLWLTGAIADRDALLWLICTALPALWQLPGAPGCLAILVREYPHWRLCANLPAVIVQDIDCRQKCPSRSA